VETADGVALDEKAVAATLREVTKLAGNIVRARTGALPNDGKVIADERDYSK
jgi:phenylacetate-CoA ligase